MLCFDFIFYYFIKSWREYRKRRRGRRRRDAKGLKLKNIGKDVEKNVDAVDGNSSDEEDDDIVASTERTIISSVVMIWAMLEVFSLVLSLIFMVKEGFKDNFMAELCYKREEGCRYILRRIIYYKLLVALTLLIGVKYVS